MAERSEAMVLRKTGGRQNVVLLRTLKRTRLASASTCLNLGWISFYKKKKKHHINFHRTIYRAPGRCVRFCICTASDKHQKDLPRKSHRTENSMNGNEQEWKECRKDMKGKKRKQRRGKEKRGSKGVSPCALRTQIFQKKEKKING